MIAPPSIDSPVKPAEAGGGESSSGDPVTPQLSQLERYITSAGLGEYYEGIVKASGASTLDDLRILTQDDLTDLAKSLNMRLVASIYHLSTVVFSKLLCGHEKTRPFVLKIQYLKEYNSKSQ